MIALQRDLVLVLCFLSAACQAPGERMLETDTIRVRIEERGSGPLVLFLHGFPELAHSWRFQLEAFSAAGYHAVAPDMRGYGGTEAPEPVEAYDLIELASDVVALMDALGEEQAVLVGHDWGAVVAWTAALQYPERFSSLVAIGVPYGKRGEVSYVEALRRQHGENFHYILYFQEPGVAEAELDPDPRAVFERFLAGWGAEREPPAITDPRAAAGGLLGRYGRVRSRPDWLSEEDLNHYVDTFRRTGFGNGLKYYRNFDRSWERTAHLVDDVVQVPVLFLAGQYDLVIGGASKGQLEAMMAPVTRDLTVRLIPDSGHWLQQERAAEVNAAILEFLEQRDS